MKNFYWIDSFEGYPSTMTHPIASSLDIYRDIYPFYTEARGYRFCLVRLEDLTIDTAIEPAVRHGVYGDLLRDEGAAYVGLIHPNLQKERKLEAIYRLVAQSENLILLNHTPSFPMVCKDKFNGINIARKLGLSVPPTSLVGAESALGFELESVERAVGPYPMFVRPADLTAGLGKKVVHDRAGLQRYIEHPPFPGRMSIIQPSISVAAEYRVYLASSDIIACRKREPLTEGEACETPLAIASASQVLAGYLKTSYLCVDWIWNGSQFWFCEFETGGGFTELCEPYRGRVAAAFFRKLAG